MSLLLFVAMKNSIQQQSDQFIIGRFFIGSNSEK